LNSINDWFLTGYNPSVTSYGKNRLPQSYQYYNCFDVVNCVGLIHIAASVGLALLAPRKKISVMLIGNHSAGKSSFINWYEFITLFDLYFLLSQLFVIKFLRL